VLEVRRRHSERFAERAYIGIPTATPRVAVQPPDGQVVGAGDPVSIDRSADRVANEPVIGEYEHSARVEKDGPAADSG
jgi:hypothetical protein